MKIDTLEQIQPSTQAFKEVIRLRKSCRGFLDTPVPDHMITSVLEDAQLALSNCNTQPWETHIVSGDKLKELSEALLRENNAERFSPDFTFDTNEYHGRYQERYLWQTFLLSLTAHGLAGIPQTALGFFAGTIR